MGRRRLLGLIGMLCFGKDGGAELRDGLSVGDQFHREYFRFETGVGSCVPGLASY